MTTSGFESAVAQHYAVMDSLGRLEPSAGGGYLRAAYSEQESAAISYIEAEALKLGASSRRDAVGNLFLDWSTAGGAVIEFGSHLDTVPQGGNFDGVAGVVAGLVAIAQLPLEERKSLRLRVWRGEESSTFNCAYLGSLSAFGKLNPKVLTHRFGGRSLEDAMRSQGADPEMVRLQRASISQAEIDSIAAHIELHIEQGNVLEVHGKDIGIVTSIRGPRRIRVVLKGAFDHSGATPLGVQFRQDVNLALAHILVRLDELAKAQLAAGEDLVQTCGVINAERDFNENNSEVYANAVPKVSGFGYFCFDIRSSNNQFRAHYAAEAERLIHLVAAEFRVRAEISLLGESAGIASLDKQLQRALASSATALALPSCDLPSGAGHDAAVVAQQRRSDGTPVPVGMIFIPCRAGKSHCPEEYTSLEAIARGAQVLQQSVRELRAG